MIGNNYGYGVPCPCDACTGRGLTDEDNTEDETMIAESESYHLDIRDSRGVQIGTATIWDKGLFHALSLAAAQWEQENGLATETPKGLARPDPGSEIKVK